MLTCVTVTVLTHRDLTEPNRIANASFLTPRFARVQMCLLFEYDRSDQIRFDPIVLSLSFNRFSMFANRISHFCAPVLLARSHDEVIKPELATLLLVVYSRFGPVGY